YRGLASRRSTTFSYASGERSARNASISSGVGGSPVRSYVTRLRSVRGSAGGAGANPFSPSFERTNASIGVLAQGPAGGTAGLTSGLSDQCLSAEDASSGHAAPSSIQRRMISILSFESRSDF